MKRSLLDGFKARAALSPALMEAHVHRRFTSAQRGSKAVSKLPMAIRLASKRAS